MIFPPQDIWNIAELPEAVRAALRDSGPGSEQAAFARLLDSDSIAARGYALEIYSLLWAETRWGTAFELSAFGDRVHEQAVRLLGAPPLAAGVSGALVADADHASALRAMWAVSRPDDLAILLRSLRSASTALTQDRAARAALFWLQRWPDRPLELGVAMRALVRNTSAAASARCTAMRCLAVYRGPESDAVLLDASRDPDLQIATNAAWVLARLDLEQHRPHLERLVEAWGSDPPYLGESVREALGVA
jgi:hypothetical protein